MDINDDLPQAELVLCIDVLIHQDTVERFDTLLRKLSAAARRRLVITGYDEPPRFRSEIIRYYKPITTALEEIGCFSEIRIIGKHAQTVLVSADMRSFV